MTKNGFRKRKYCNVYVNKKENVVVKIPWTSPRKPAKIAVPTVTVQKNGERWYIQPLCKAFRLKDKLKYAAILDYYAYRPVDIHEGNLGLYRNKVVAFDW